MERPAPTPELAKQVAKQNLPPAVATGIRKFERRVFKPAWTREGERFEGENYAIRLGHNGRRMTVNLGTPDLREAARKASRFHAVLKVSGWDAAIADLSPESARIRAIGSTPTVGELIAAAERLAVHVKAASIRQYGQSLRWLAAEVRGISSNGSKFDPRSGGAEKWRAEVDAVPVGDLTARAIEAALAAYVKRRGTSDAAKRTASSFVRQARGLWSRKLLRLLPFEELPNPFADVLFERPRAPRYVPTFDSRMLVQAARATLRGVDPEAWKAFLLLLAAGLRKGEADAILWSNVDVERGVVRVVTGKTVESVGEVPIGEEAAAEFRALRGTASGLFVLEGTATNSKGLRTYRAASTFNRLSIWLRKNGVNDPKPLHSLRKEAGSLVNAVGGIHAASRFLRHSDIAVTAAHYLDGRQKIVVPVFGDGARGSTGAGEESSR